MLEDNYAKFNSDLRKIQDEYNYESRGHGSISICSEDVDDVYQAGVNWSCCGTQSPKYARDFCDALNEAIKACEKLNSKYSIE